MKNLILFIFGYLAIIICKILNKFIKFKITVLATSRIGHLTQNFELILLLAPKNTLIFIGSDNKVANNFILDLFKKHKNIFFQKFLNIFIIQYFMLIPNQVSLLYGLNLTQNFLFN